MTDILFTANGASATVLVSGELTSGMVGVPVRFAFDSDWDGLNIVVVFDGSGRRISVPLLTGYQGVLPWEVIAKANTRLHIGAEGRKSDGSIVIPTVWANAGYIREGAAATDDEGNPPTPSIYDQIMAAIEAGKLQGKPGEDGVSPTVSVTEIEGGHRVTITDENGKQVFDVMDGKDGSDASVNIVDDLDTKDPNAALSANMGAALREKIDTDLLTVQKELQAEIKQRVKTVNGVSPDENGNVVVEGGNGTGGVAVETDPTVPAWAKQPNKPTYTAEEVGAQPSGNYALKSEIPSVPVKSVNGKTGAVVLSASDVNARSSLWLPTYTEIGAEKSGTAASAVSTHNTNTAAHNDIRMLITALTTRLDALADSDDETLDQMAEVVAYIKANRDLIEQITTGKVSVSDIVNNLTTNVSNKPLSAAQGVALKALIDAITVPTKLSQLQNDSGYITGYTETDPTVPAWAKNATKPSYSKSEVGLGNVENVKQYSASNPPPYPVTSVNGKTGAVSLTIPTVPTKVSAFTNDAGYLTQHQDISGKLDASALPTAINTALAQAKASGEFDGEDGYTPVKGKDYFDGKDGKTPVKGVDYFDGTDGEDGTDGKTPVRGVDYWTSADKAEIEAHIATELAKRGQLQPEYADSIDKCTDTTKLYVLPDGMIYAWMLTEKEVETGGGYTNALDGVTININKRWSHSSKGLSSANGYATMIVPVTTDKKVYVNIPRVAFLGNYPRIHYMDASNNYVTTIDRLAANAQVLSTDANGVTSWTTGYECSIAGDASSNARLAKADNIAQMVLVLSVANAKSNTTNDTTAITEADVADLIVSIGNPIVEGGTEIIKEYAWASTGLAFVPADYEPRIIELEQKATNHTARIVALEKSVESGSADETEAAALSKIQKWDKPVYDPAPVTLIADNRVKPALTTNDRTISAIYAKYRALMAAHPDYITETNMGKSSASSTFTAVDMLRFDFCEPGGLTQPDMNDSARHETKPTLIFLSGIHTEWVGVWGLYYALEEIATNPDFDDVRRNARIVVIPCANPFCLTSQTAIDGWRMSHVNANGVAIHNNFGVNHSTSGAVGEYNYGGSAPYSEPETQYIDAVMAEYPDAVAFVSCHNNDYSTYYGSHVIWASSATYHMCNVAFRLVDKLTKAWLNKYGQTLKDSIDQYKINMDANDYRLGRATMSTSKGTEQLNATKYGIMGVNLEISRMMKVFSGNTDGTSEVMTHGAEVYANFMRTLLWNYDHKDKKEYAPNLPWSE